MGQHVTIGMAAGRSVTTRLESHPHGVAGGVVGGEQDVAPEEVEEETQHRRRHPENGFDRACQPPPTGERAQVNGTVSEHERHCFRTREPPENNINVVNSDTNNVTTTPDR